MTGEVYLARKDAKVGEMVKQEGMAKARVR